MPLIREKRSIKRRSVGFLGCATLLLTFLVLLSAPTQAQVVKTKIKIVKKTIGSNNRLTSSEGLLLGSPTTYIDFNGFNGMELKVSRPRTPLYDYTLMFWARSVRSLQELRVDDTIKDTPTYLFKLENSVGCYISRTEKEDGTVKDQPFLLCETGNGSTTKDIVIDLADLPDIQSWMHFTYSAIYRPASTLSGIESESYLRIDHSTYSKVSWGGYKPVKSSRVYYAAGGPEESDLGFMGHYRQFWITVGYIDPANVPFLAHEYKVLDYSSMAYYRFEQSIFIGRYDDAFRVQKARPLRALPEFVQENVSAPFCNSIPAKQVDVPQFYRAMGSKFSGIAIPRFKYKERYIGYTASFWVKNFGEHAFEPNPAKGRQNNHIFSLDECFSLWYDSKTSFRVYVYAKNNFFETFSDPVFLPMLEWINIQVTISQQSGITVMTFNQNGERQQLVQNKIFLAEQYPRGTISFFQSFIGIPYKLYIWEQFIELPVVMEDARYEETLLIAHDFSNYEDGSSDSGFEGWPTLISPNGENLAATKGDGFDFVIDNVPSGANFARPVLSGQLQAQSTDWDVTCPAPTANLMYIGGKGSKFEMTILVETTTKYTVEFWFKANVQEFAANPQERTFLYMMNGRADGMSDQQFELFSFNIMVIYVEDNEMKCAPFGFLNGELKDKESVLTYKDVNPLIVEGWQHISCILTRQKFVKGQYLQVDLDEEGVDLIKSSFRDIIKLPRTFAKELYQTNPKAEILIQNYQLAQRWNIILGNDKVRSKSFYGSFKDVRVWKTARSDAELYSYRFNQAQDDADLQGNMKFMDGSFDVYNDADTTSNGPRYPKTESTMQLLATDPYNIVCSVDTYFNTEQQKCTRYPYTRSPSLVYMVTNDIQHGHQMVLERRLESTMKLPGSKYQPRTRTKWKLVEPEKDETGKAEVKAIMAKYFQNRGLESYSLDPIFMGDYKEYSFQIEMTDTVNHNFFLQTNQTIIPRKCLQVVDSETFTNQRKIDVNLNGSTEDLVFQFEVRRIDGCADEYINKLQEYVRVEVQPPITGLEDKLIKTFDRVTGKFTMTAPVSLLNSAGVPKNIPSDIIFYLFWSSVELNDRISYMNIVYSVTLASEIGVSMSVTSMADINARVIDVGSDPDLTINATCSSVWNDPNGNQCDFSSGLSFRWDCGKSGEFQSADLAEYCDQWTGSPILVIPNQKIRDNDLINKGIEITCKVSSVEASEQTGDAAKILQFGVKKDQRIFKWVNTRVPRFTIEYSNGKKTDNGYDVVLTSAEQTISIKPDGWTPSDGYEIRFKVIELDDDGKEGEVAIETEDKDVSETSITIKPGVLKAEQSYQLNVIAKRTATEENVKLKLVVPYIKKEEFKTVQLPPDYTFDISPAEGVMYQDEFQVTLNVADPANLEYLVLGILKNERGQETEIRLTEAWVQASQPTYKGTLPKLERIIITIRNKEGEVRSEEKSVVVNKQEGVDWVEILEDVSGGKEQKWQKYLFIAGDANSDAAKTSIDPNKTEAQRKKSEIDARKVNDFLAINAFDTIRTINQESSKKTDRKLLQNIIGTIAKISAYSQFMEPIDQDMTPEQTIRIIQLSVETIEYALRFKLISIINELEPQRKDLVQAIGQLLDVTASRAQLQKALLKYTKKTKGDLTMSISWSKVGDLESEKLVETEIAQEQGAGVANNETGDPITVDEPVAAERLLASQPDAAWQVPRSLQAESKGQEVILTVDEATNEQFLVLYRDLLVKIIVIKNSHADQLCQIPAANKKILTVKTAELQQQVIRLPFNTNEGELKRFREFTVKGENIRTELETEIKATLPTDKLMTETRILNSQEPNFEWMCLQVSFMRPNPAAGFEPNSAQQFFFENQRIMQVGVLDSNGHHLLDSAEKIEGGQIKLSYKQKFLPDYYYFEGQSFCANYNSQSDIIDTEWTDRDQECKTEYAEPGKFDNDYGFVTCTCNKVRNFYYTMMTDLTRTRIYPSEMQNLTHDIMNAILLPLILIGLIFPCMMIMLDARDYQNIEDNVYPVDDLTIAQLERATNKLCKQQIYYNEKEISRYLELNENDFRSGSCVAFSTFQRTLHPYFSLFLRFDYRSKRLTRFFIVLGQISLVTVLLWFAYSEPASELFSEMIGWDIETWKERRQLFISIALSIVTIPFPDRCCCFFKTTMFLLNDESKAPQEYLSEVEQFVKDHAADDENPQQTEAEEPIVKKDNKSAMKEGKGEEDALVDEKEEKEPLNLEQYVRPALFDQFLWCKMVGLILIFLFWIISIIITIVLMDISGKQYTADEMAGDPMKDLIFLTPAEAQEFVIAWFLAIFVWGVILNEVRILIITLMAPIQAQNIFNKQMDLLTQSNLENERDEALKNFHSSFCAKCSCATCCLIPPESVAIALDALFTIDIKLHRLQKSKKYEVKIEQKDRFHRAYKAEEMLAQKSQSLTERANALQASKKEEVEMSSSKKKKGKNLTTKGSEKSKTSKKTGKKEKKEKKKKKDK